MDSSSQLWVMDIRSKSSTINPWDCLPDELVSRILAILPFSNIYYARAVCRRWRSIIWCPLFLSMCPLKSVRLPWLLEFQQHMYNQAWAYDLHGKQWFHLNFSFLLENAKIIAASGGLVCLRKMEDTGCTLFVCNPVTRNWKRLPRIESESKLVLLDVDQNSHNYRIIVLNLGESGDASGSVLVFYSRLGVWREIQGVPAGMHADSICDATVFSGSLYCLTTHKKMEVFDPERGTWVAPIPCNLGSRLNNFSERYICGMKGHLFMVILSHARKDVYVLQYDWNFRLWKSHKPSPERIICASHLSSLSCASKQSVGDIFIACSMGKIHVCTVKGLYQHLPRSPLTGNKIQGAEVSVKMMWFEPRTDAAI